MHPSPLPPPDPPDSDCRCRHDVPVLSIVDLDDFRHDDAVEELLEDMFYESSSLQDPDDITVTTCASSGSDSDEDVAPTAASMRSIRFPDFDDVVPNYDPVDNTPRILHALYDLPRQVLELDIRAVDLYADLRAVSPLLSPVVAPKAHVDGGSIATTTDRLEYLFCYREFTADERRTMVRLKVADDTVHVPTGAGYIKVP